MTSSQISEYGPFNITQEPSSERTTSKLSYNIIRQENFIKNTNKLVKKNNSKDTNSVKSYNNKSQPRKDGIEIHKKNNRRLTDATTDSRCRSVGNNKIRTFSGIVSDPNEESVNLRCIQGHQSLRMQFYLKINSAPANITHKGMIALVENYFKIYVIRGAALGEIKIVFEFDDGSPV